MDVRKSSAIYCDYMRSQPSDNAAISDSLFIAEGGPECFEQKRDEIQGCLNNTVSQYLPKNTTSLNSIPSLVLEEPECRDMKLLQGCVVKVLEGCSEPTPANIVESLFNYVWQMTPCHAMKSLSRTGADPNSAPRETAAVLGLTAASLLLALALGSRV
uniref:Uncharacterized protein n=1 Tax=Timema douglasi TaxID=61478 RepID=A0A7R8ZCU8_TIMDO|nr:unnamed protein product [Timema douglasi]